MEKKTVGQTTIMCSSRALLLTPCFFPHPESELKLHVLSEAGGVVVSNCLSVTERFQDRVGLQEVPLHAFHCCFLSSVREEKRKQNDKKKIIT